MLMRNIIFILLVMNPDYMLLSCYINFILSSSSVESSYLPDMPRIPYFYSIFSHQLVCAWSGDSGNNKRTFSWAE
jgi:hypothetical protein